jgi:hypothetical protein
MKWIRRKKRKILERKLIIIGLAPLLFACTGSSVLTANFIGLDFVGDHL